MDASPGNAGVARRGHRRRRLRRADHPGAAGRCHSAASLPAGRPVPNRSQARCIRRPPPVKTGGPADASCGPDTSRSCAECARSRCRGGAEAEQPQAPGRVVGSGTRGRSRERCRRRRTPRWVPDGVGADGLQVSPADSPGERQQTARASGASGRRSRRYPPSWSAASAVWTRRTSEASWLLVPMISGTWRVAPARAASIGARGSSSTPWVRPYASVGEVRSALLHPPTASPQRHCSCAASSARADAEQFEELVRAPRQVSGRRSAARALAIAKGEQAIRGWLLGSASTDVAPADSPKR